MCALASNRDGKLCSWASTARNNTDPKVHSHPAPCTRVNMLGDLFLEKVSTLVHFGARVNTRFNCKEVECAEHKIRIKNSASYLHFLIRMDRHLRTSYSTGLLAFYSTGLASFSIAQAC